MTKDQIIEQSIIGAILLNPRVNFDLVTGEGVTVESFADPANKNIFAAMRALVAEGRGIDHQGITSKKEVGPAAFDHLVRCMENIITTIELPAWIERLKELESRRAVADGALRLAQGAEGDLPTESLLGLLPEIEATARAKKGRGGLLSTGELCDSLIGKIGKPLDTLPLFPDCTDAGRLIQLHHGELMVIGGHSGQGKTALAAGMTFNMLHNNCAVVYICTESSSEDIAARIAGYGAGVPHYIGMGPYASKEQRERFAASVEITRRIGKRLQIVGCERGMITPAVIDAAIRRCKAINGRCDCVFVDFMQGVTAPPELSKKSGLEQTNSCIEGLHSSFLRHQTAGVVLSQYNRQGTFAGGPPTLDWLKDSSLLAQLSHTVAFLIRGGEKHPTEALLKSGKTRNQGEFTVSLKWNGAGYHSADSLAWPDDRQREEAAAEGDDF